MSKIFNFCAFSIIFILVANFCKSDDWNFYNRFDVGSQPVAIIVDSNNLIPQCYIICYGIDKNYNDIYEEGDEYPSLWRLNIGMTTSLNSMSDFIFETEKIRDFPFGSIGIPFRPAIDKDTLYICQLGKISSYLLNGEDLGEIFYRNNAVAVSKKDNKLFVSVRESMDTNYVLVYDLIKKEIIDSIPAYQMVQQTLPIGDDMLAILCEGDWGSNNSKIIFAKVDGKHEILYTMIVGNEGNHITNRKNLFAITTGDNMLLVYNVQPQGFELISAINLPTSGFDGIRESIFYNDSIIFTSSWDSHIYISDLTDISLPKFLDAKGKAEGMAFANFLDTYTILIITNQFVTGTYLPDNKITIYSNFPITSVSENYLSKKTKLYPQPIKDLGILEFENINSENISKAAVYNILGEYLGDAEIITNNFAGKLLFKFSNLNLSQGTYNLVVYGNGFQKAFLFVKE